MRAATRPSLSSIFVKIRNYCFFIIPKVFKFEYHNVSFLDGFIQLESSTKLCDIPGRSWSVRDPVIRHINNYSCRRLHTSKLAHWIIEEDILSRILIYFPTYLRQSNFEVRVTGLYDFAVFLPCVLPIAEIWIVWSQLCPALRMAKLWTQMLR